MSALMDIITGCENQLGWSPPPGAPLYKSRAAEHRKLSLAMSRHNYTTHDLKLALAYCKRRRQPVTSPLELTWYITKARELAAAEPSAPGALDVGVRTAIEWENANPDDISDAWITRLVRSFGPARARTLSEWRDAGRGC